MKPYKKNGMTLLIVLAVMVFWVGCSSENEKKPEETSVASPKDSVVPDVSHSPVVPTPEAVTEEATPASAEEGTLPSEILLRPDIYESLTKPPVMLTHDKHIRIHNIGCNECHHVFENGENIWAEGMDVQKCEVCHNEPTIKGETKLPPDEMKKNLKLAFHNNCRTCHKVFKKENPETFAPVTCKQCHRD